MLDNISSFGTYAQFMQMDDGEIYLFYRHGVHWSDGVYQTSSDGGRTSQAPVSVLTHKVQAADPTTHDARYAWFGKRKVGHSKERINA